MQEIRLTDPRAIKTIDAFAQRHGVINRDHAAALFINLVADLAGTIGPAAPRPLPERVPFGVALRIARKDCGLSQSELARKAGVSGDAVYRAEANRGRPRIHPSTARALAQALPPYTDQLLHLASGNNNASIKSADKESAA